MLGYCLCYDTTIQKKKKEKEMTLIYASGIYSSFHRSHLSLCAISNNVIGFSYGHPQHLNCVGFRDSSHNIAQTEESAT